MLELQNLLTGVCPLKEVRDSWVLALDKSRFFTVKSAYIHLSSLQFSEPIDNRMGPVFAALWRCSIPSKITIFAWKLLR